VISGTRQLGAMTCLLPGSASASLEMGALREFAFRLFHLQDAHTHTVHTCEQARALCVCVDRRPC